MIMCAFSLVTQFVERERERELVKSIERIRLAIDDVHATGMICDLHHVRAFASCRPAGNNTPSLFTKKKNKHQVYALAKKKNNNRIVCV
jgi:hypothetical protein